MLGVLANNPDKAPEILGAFFERLEKAEPNQGHLSLAELEKMGLLKSVVTQNVDGLHRLAGSSTVYELHGSMYGLRCAVCGQKRQLDSNDPLRTGAEPRAANCQSFHGREGGRILFTSKRKFLSNRHGGIEPFF